MHVLSHRLVLSCLVGNAVHWKAKREIERHSETCTHIQTDTGHAIPVLAAASATATPAPAMAAAKDHFTFPLTPLSSGDLLPATHFFLKELE